MSTRRPTPARARKPAAGGSRRPSIKGPLAAAKALARDVVAQIDGIIESHHAAGELDIGGVPLDVSNLDKVFFPETGHTKGDLLRYYARISPWLLPAIDGRPLVLKRFPNGVGSKAFFQQRAPDDVPPGVRVEPVSDEGLTTRRRLVGGDLPTLLYTIQLGAISVDPWHGRLPDVSRADYSIVDLDPGDDVKFAKVIDVARWIHDELDALGLHGLPKTSGSTGIHIVLPLDPEASAETARLVAELVATRTAERHPKAATIHRWVQTRPKGTVYVDFLQNIRGKTVAAVYAARARPEPSVSTPLRWEEVAPGLDPRDFTIDNVPDRVAEVGDLWGDAMRRPNDLQRLAAGAR